MTMLLEEGTEEIVEIQEGEGEGWGTSDEGFLPGQFFGARAWLTHRPKMGHCERVVFAWWINGGFFLDMGTERIFCSTEGKPLRGLGGGT